MSLTDKTVIVTGAGVGIGAAAALALAEAGAKVAVVDIDAAAAEAMAAKISNAGGTAVAITADCGDVEQIQAMVDKTVETFGRLDIILNNAGVTRRAPRSRITSCCSSTPVMPPIPVPTIVPKRSRCASGTSRISPKPASASASSEAINAHIVKGSSLRWSFTSKPHSSGFHATWAAMVAVIPVVSNRSRVVTPFSPARIRGYEVATSRPRALTVPRPVMTTRRMGCGPLEAA